MDKPTFEEIELLLITAVSISPNSIKDIAAASGIKASTLYKWHSDSVPSCARTDT